MDQYPAIAAGASATIFDIGQAKYQFLGSGQFVVFDLSSFMHVIKPR
jgi:hypothetical protein